VDGRVTIDQGLSVIIVTQGEVQLRCAASDPLELPCGSTTVVPFDAGTPEINGHGEIVVCGPPEPMTTQ
jgi:mannose-6-phosphate isomerase